MRGQLFDVKQHQPERIQNLFRSQQGEVREMLMVDRVKLILLDQLQQVRELERQNPSGLEQDLDSSNKVAEIGNLRQNIVADQQIRLFTLRSQLSSQPLAKKLHQCRNLLLLGNFRHVGGRLNAQHRNLFLDKVLQQVAIVAGQFHNQTPFIQPKPVAHLIGVAPAVFQPAVGVGREVGVLGKNVIGTYEL